MQFAIESSSSLPIYQQIVRQVREAIAKGDLAADTRLPSVRQLSRDLVVNPNTIARAFTELERDGMVVSRPGLGVFVANSKTELTQAARNRRLIDSVDRLLTEAVHLDFTSDVVVRKVADRAKEFHWKTEGHQ